MRPISSCYLAEISTVIAGCSISSHSNIIAMIKCHHTQVNSCAAHEVLSRLSTLHNCLRRRNSEASPAPVEGGKKYGIKILISTAEKGLCKAVNNITLF